MAIRAPAATSDKPDRLATLVWVALAFIIAVAAAVGSVSLTLVENKQACPLCFYQRAFALSVVAVLAMGLFSGAVSSGRLAVLALPLAIGGLGVAAFHVSLEVRDVLECPAGLFGVLTAPKQSLAVFTVLTIVLAAGLGSSMSAREISFPTAILAVALGGGLVWASITANPKLPDPPTKPYDGPANVCRPPYHAAESK